MRHFFEEYKALENKTVVVEEFGDKVTALQIIQEAIDLYKQKYLELKKQLKNLNL